MESPDPVQELEGNDAVHVLRLWQRVLDSTAELAQRRQAMTEGTVEEESICDFDQPKLVGRWSRGDQTRKSIAQGDGPWASLATIQA
jgi:hypothetical protein